MRPQPARSVCTGDRADMTTKETLVNMENQKVKAGVNAGKHGGLSLVAERRFTTIAKWAGTDLLGQ